MKALILFSLLFFVFCLGSKAQNQLGIVALGYTPTTVSIVADNQVVDVSTKNYVRLSSDNATATNRTVTLTRGTVFGQQLIIEYINFPNSLEFIDNSSLIGGGNLRIANGFGMNSFDILGLVWNGVDWVQIFRSVN